MIHQLVRQGYLAQRGSDFIGLALNPVVYDAVAQKLVEAVSAPVPGGELGCPKKSLPSPGRPWIAA